MTRSLILASSSPFRRQLLDNAGLVFQAEAAKIDERAIEARLQAEGADPQRVALVLAQAKAIEVSRRHADAFVIGSDQTMSLGDRVYHKPATLEEAREALLSLSGKTHYLNSGVALALDGNMVWGTVVQAAMTVRNLTPQAVDAYLARAGETVLQSVGSYQVEGEGIRLFERIDGDYFTIIGLPLLPLLQALRERGAVND
ncbi:Maf-like protein [Rhizobium sp. SSA_523]|uniref:Maf-like protein n=1 Tax=Rhizobium sp. SSA_523 TaxID=2952477 RepID=UPI0020911F95|nr:Maf-like protein [Rhizobium sp. SSA_523]MCO5734621.1 Maf-like protein [Rhizobium sp. SSA_523]WKC23396.1 Maf-like protein [Rhizobium sp. SSA_523]